MSEGRKGLKIIDEGCAPSAQSCVSQVESSPSPAAFCGRAAVVTLGCAKNQVDSEVMLGVLREQGYELTSDLSRADVAIVNTCGFLEAATRESIDAILEAASWKKKGRLRKLIVAGCVVERYRDELEKTLPEVDAFMRVDEILDVARLASEEGGHPLKEGARPYFLYDDSMPRVIAPGSVSAYVKISDGCDRPCAFCTIPRIRGAMRSRSAESILREISALGAAGVKEVNLVAQDLTAWGSDRGEKFALEGLLRQIDASRSVPWVRLLYSYPLGINEALLRSLVELPALCEYLDLPLQHSSERILKAMQRPVGRFAARPMVELIRKTAPEVSLRTTFITGYPGEDESDVDDLASLISEGHFSSVGIFTYSQEDGTPSAAQGPQVPQKEKERRRKHLMLTQQEVVQQRLGSCVGTELDVLIEGPHPETPLLWAGRSRFQAPDVDGLILVNDVQIPTPELRPGALCRVQITEQAGYDLLGTAVSLV